jgi:biotin carboxyl carrier protein
VKACSTRTATATCWPWATPRWAYDPAFAYEIAVIVREGLRRMLEDGENVVYYLTIMNEFYPMPPMPEGSEDGILKGSIQISRFREQPRPRSRHLLGSGAILNEALKAQKILEDDYGVAADVWSVTSYKNLYWDATDTERWNLRSTPEKKPRVFRIWSPRLAGEKGVFVAASDYLKALPAMIAKWLPGPLFVLGTDGYGRSETREALRDFFEVDARHIAFAALSHGHRQKSPNGFEDRPRSDQSLVRIEEGDAMNKEIKVPEIGENVESGVVVAVHIKVGDTLAVDDTVIELETDKALVEIPSPFAGRVTEVLAEAGEQMKVGQVIARLDTTIETSADEAMSPDPSSSSEEKKDETTTNADEASEPTKSAEEKEDEKATESSAVAKDQKSGIDAV